MVQLNKAVLAVARYIISNELYSFKSLSDKTQERLVKRYGSKFEIDVNKAIGLVEGKE